MTNSMSNKELIEEARNHVEHFAITGGDALRVTRLADALEAAESVVEWGTAVSDDPETIVLAKSEESARYNVKGWNKRSIVVRGERPRGVLYRRTVSPWVEVTE